MRTFKQFISDIDPEDIPRIIHEYDEFRKTGVLSDGILRQLANDWTTNLGISSQSISTAAMAIADEVCFDIAMEWYRNL